MNHQTDPPSRSGATRGASSRDAGLLRIRSLTKGVAVTAALGSVALGVVLAQPAHSQVASATTAAPGVSTDNSNTAPAPPPDQGNQQDQSNQLAAPAQPPADNSQQAPPAAVSGGS